MLSSLPGLLERLCGRRKVSRLRLRLAQFVERYDISSAADLDGAGSLKSLPEGGFRSLRLRLRLGDSDFTQSEGFLIRIADPVERSEGRDYYCLP